jgi:crossover junction endodeoxyribonuclease RuvC
MIILGIDPGSRCMGYGVLQADGSRQELLDQGVLRLDTDTPHTARLADIYEGADALIDEHAPDECAIEMPVYGRNPQSMLKLGRAQAAAMLAPLHYDMQVTEYAPKEVKRAATGNGNADKKQVRYMIASMLGVDPPDDLALDASDALAVALCHQNRQTGHAPKQHSGWAGFVKDNPDRVSG